MKVADLFAALRIQPDSKSFAIGEKMLSALRSRLAGIASLAAAAFQTRNALNWVEALGRLDIASKGALGSIAEVQKRILGVSDETGVAKEQILAGANAFVALTGDGKTAAESMSTFARVAMATGANMDDIANAAGAMATNLGITGPEMEKTFSILIAGGKAGAVELKDMAGYMAELSAESQNFADGQGVGAVAELGAAFQLVRRGAGSAAEASTKLKRLLQSMSSPKTVKALKGMGIAVEEIGPDGKTRMRAFGDIMAELAGKGLKDTELANVFESAEARSAFKQLSKVPGEWEKITAETMEANDVAEDYAKAQQNAALKVRKAWNKFLNLLTRVFAKVVDALSWLTDHTLELSIALTSLAAAFTLVQWAAIKSAIATAAAWAAAVLPFILIAALIAAVILVLQDLYTWFRGGDSIFGDWIQILKEAASAVVDWFVAKFRALFDWIEEKIDWLVDKARSVARKLDPRTWLDAVDGDAESTRKAVNEFNAQVNGSLPGMKRPDTLKNIVNNAQVTINAPHADADEVVRKVRDVFRDMFDGEVRAAAAATGQ